MERIVEADILEILERDDVSDLGDFSDDEDIQNEEIFENVTVTGDNDDSDDDVDDNTIYENVGLEEAEQYTNRKQIIWKKGTYLGYGTAIEWHDPELKNVTDLEQPIQYFSRYITEDLLCTLVYYTNLYAVQRNIGRWSATNFQEIKTLIGILLYMGNLKFPRVRKYWEAGTTIPIIANSMNVNRFFKLRNCLQRIITIVSGKYEFYMIHCYPDVNSYP